MQPPGARTACEFIRDLRRTSQRIHFAGIDLRLVRAPWYPSASAERRPMLHTPTESWAGGEGVAYACSFCGAQTEARYRVDFNPVLTRPYVITCGRCQVKNEAE